MFLLYILFSELNYRELSGFYKKSEAGGGPPSNEGECLWANFNLLSAHNLNN